ncbi:MAG: SusC/RagA family TonB-linked outer membrane protein [Tannerella sp.]|jgi:TonB-linked SusC/RagA family outer membrane protein|nr:SusC/RagA family TonB-linked outer membrane protein [Tannerella sp.]
MTKIGIRINIKKKIVVLFGLFLFINNATSIVPVQNNRPDNEQNKSKDDTSDKKTGAITSSEIDQGLGVSIIESLKGRIAGLDISETDAGSLEITVRGANSITGDNTPLFIVNGVPFPAKIISSASVSTPLTGIRPSDVESIEVLKGADAMALYGAKAANGAVIIKTKKSNDEKLQVSVDAGMGFSQVNKRMDLLDSEDYLVMRQKALAADGLTPDMTNAYDVLSWGSKYNHNWQDLLLGNTAKVYNGQLSVGGGSENTKFSVGGGYYRTGTVLFELFDEDDVFERINGRMAINHVSPNGRFNIDASVLYSSVKNNSKGFSPSSFLTTPPNQPLYTDDHNVYWEPGITTFTTPLRYEFIDAEHKINSFIASSSLGYKIINPLSVKVDFGYTKTYSNEFQSYANGYLNPYADNSYDNVVYFGNSSSEIISIEPQMTYSDKIWEGNFTALLGGTWQSQVANKTYNQYRNFPSASLFKDPSAAAIKQLASNGADESKYASLFTRLTYDLRNKYVVNGVVRRDGSSRFYKDNRFGNFWSIGAGWIFHREEFFKIPFVSYAKLRGSYGSTGNDNVGNYMYLETYASTSYPYGGSMGLSPVQIGNENFSWEITKKGEIALDLGLFNNKVSITTAVYRNRSTNLIAAYDLPSQTGFTALRTNLENSLVQNQGVEIEISSTNISTKDFTWYTMFNISIPENKLLKYDDLDISTYATSYEIGKSLSVARMYKYTGINRETGVPLVEDVNGDGSISNLADAQFLGDLDPDFYGGLQNSFSYKGIKLDLFFQFVKRPFKAGWLANYYYPVGHLGRNVPREIYENVWTPETPDAKYPGMTTTTSSDIGYAYWNYYTESDACYEDASYIRLKNLSLSYNLPRKITSKTGAKGLQVYVRAQDLFTITSFTNWDPETGAQTPPPQTYMFGVKVSF